MTKLPIMSVSGIRGIVGESIDSLFISRIAYIQTKRSNGGKVVVGRDTRISGEELMNAAFRGIRAAGGIPLDAGIAPTPTTCVCTNAVEASTGIILTASHNPGMYNGYKMVHRSGRLFRGYECEEIYEAFRSSEYASDDKILNSSDCAAERIDASKIHISKILKHINIETIKSANIKIAVDSINGAGGAVFPDLLEKLGVKWIGVHNKLNGDFVHNPEPRPEHLGDLCKLLKETPDLWGGFVFDPDADRLATMGENGEEISEEMTLVFALENLLQRAKSDIVTNLSTSMLIDDVARKYGVNVIRSKIGEANVVEEMEKCDCQFGGEGNGGVIFPKIASARDGLGAMALILELMASTGKKLTQHASMWPRYSIVKDKIPCDGKDPAQIINRLNTVFASENKNNLDGLKIIRDYGWVHLRASNTEPIIRCYAEAKTWQQARELADMVLKEVEN